MSAAAVLLVFAVSVLGALLGHRTRRLGSRLDALARPLHELRGALAALELGLSFVERSRGLRQELNGCADSLRISLDRAALATRDIDALRRGEPAAVDVESEVNFDELVLRSVRAWSFVAPSYASSVDVDWRAGPVRVLGHAKRLQQALDNLIANALEHGGPRVLVEGERRGRLVRVLVSDGGGGLPQDLDGVLESRSGPSPGHSGSTRGHGLSIASDVIREHRGTLGLGMGSHGPGLIIELPAADRGERDHGRGASTHEVRCDAGGRTSKTA
jgi:signal transduction histidine kinase